MGLAVMTVFGMIAAVAYDFYGALRQIVSLKKRGTLLGDVLYSLIILIFFVLILLRINDGLLRSYVYLGLILGFVIYYGLIHHLLWKVIYGLTKGLIWIVQKIIAIVSWPWRMLKKCLVKPIYARYCRWKTQREKLQQKNEEDLE